MRSPFGQRLIAFLLTAAFLWCFYGAVIKRSQRKAREEVLAEEEYRELQDYVAENDLDYEKIRKVCYGSDSSDQGFVVDYLAMAMICALTIIPTRSSYDWSNASPTAFQIPIRRRNGPSLPRSIRNEPHNHDRHVGALGACRARAGAEDDLRRGQAEAEAPRAARVLGRRRGRPPCPVGEA